MLSSFGSLKCGWNFNSEINGNPLSILFVDAIFATDTLLRQATQQVKRIAEQPFGGTGNLVVVQLESSSNLLPNRFRLSGFCAAPEATQLQIDRATSAGR
jgi:hypothetical protein